MNGEKTNEWEVLGVIGGTGLDQIEDLHERREDSLVTPYGPPSAPLVHGRLGQQPVVFLARHGQGHTLAPHEINYRANLWALRETGVDAVIGVAAVGGIAEQPTPGGLCVPDQLIDYTHGRPATFFEGVDCAVEHVDFTQPYSAAVRERILTSAQRAGIDVADGGCYGATQGPRLETAAEIRRMERDGCTIVGMTGMPEAALAREIGVDYACCAVVVNLAAGKGSGPISMDAIREHLGTGMERVRKLLLHIASD